MASTSGTFQFLVAETETSLYRNSKVLMERLPNGNTGGSQGIDLEGRSMEITDARSLSEPLTCETNGFELCQDPLVQPVDFLDHTTVVYDYYPLCETLVSRVTGAQAFAFDHNIRSAGGKEAQVQIKGGQEVQGPAHVVHGDYTLQSAPDRLQQLAQPPSGNDTLLGILPDNTALIPPEALARAKEGRFAIINVWRNIDDKPVATHPIALCDAQTVEPEELVVFEIHYPDRIGENYFAKYSDRQRMYYYPEVNRDEALLIKQWDSAGPLARSQGALGDGQDRQKTCTFSFHSAFDDPKTPDNAPDRWSIEVRCLVIY
ncbi:MAG: hypothetical protein GKR90_09590 [Pseudomonadales bacterium]|nr:hypothetical protein [Pseudomonadales bacterium]